MERINSFFASYGLDFHHILTWVIILTAVIFVGLLILRLFKVAIGIFLVVTIVPILCTLFFGDGSDLIDQAAKYLPPETGQQLEESYDYFKERERMDPVLDTEQIHDDLQEKLNETVSGIVSNAKESFEE